MIRDQNDFVQSQLRFQEKKLCLMLDFLSILITGIMEIEKKVVKPHGRLVMVS